MRNKCSEKELIEKKIQVESIKTDIASFGRKLMKEEKIMYINMLRDIGCTYKEIGGILGCCGQRVRDLINQDELTQEKRDNKKMLKSRSRYKRMREQLINDLKDLYKNNEELYNITNYKRFSACIKYFGTWENALAEAGIIIRKLDSNSEKKENLEYTEEQLMKYEKLLEEIDTYDYKEREQAKVSLRIWIENEGISHEQLEIMKDKIVKNKRYKKSDANKYDWSF